MAFTASACWEVETTGNDASAGGFDPGVAGFPTDLTTDANTGNTSAPVCSSASYNFVAGDVGAWIYVKSGTSWTPGWYKITSVATNKATVNATIGAAVLAAGTPSTVTGIATVGTPTAGTWGIDYSQQAAARIAFSDMVIDGTTNTKFTSALKPVGKNFVGNIINVTAGTGFTVQRVVVVSTSGTTATCDKSLGTLSSTGGTGNLGGAMASPALPFSVAIASNTIFVKSGAYSITSASTNVAGGCISDTVAVRAEGYGTVRGDLGTAPTLTASGISTAVIMTVSAADGAIANLTIDGATLASIQGLNAARGIYRNITCKNCTNFGIATSASAIFVRCVTTGCSTQAAFSGAGQCIDCVSHDNTSTGFTSGAACCFSGCIAYNNSGASVDGFLITGALGFAINCASYNNGRDGFRCNNVCQMCVNSIAESNTGIGFNMTTGALLNNCAAYSNGTNFSNAGARATTLNSTTGTASFFVAAASGNFALNANAGGGASLRAAGIPGVTPDGLSTGYLDIGGLQSKALETLGLGFNGGLAA